MVDEGIIAVTAESGELAFFKHNPQAQQQIVKSSAASMIMVPEDEEMDASHSSGKYIQEKQKTKKGGFKPF